MRSRGFANEAGELLDECKESLRDGVREEILPRGGAEEQGEIVNTTTAIVNLSCSPNRSRGERLHH